MTKLHTGIGVLEKGRNFTLIRKKALKDEVIKKHSHPEANVIFTVLKGMMNVYIDERLFALNTGDVLSFDGISSISVNFIEDSEVLINLINK